MEFLGSGASSGEVFLGWNSSGVVERRPFRGEDLSSSANVSLGVVKNCNTCMAKVYPARGGYGICVGCASFVDVLSSQWRAVSFSLPHISLDVLPP